MNTYRKSIDSTERQYFFVEERRFYDRARADRAAGALVAECLGLQAADADMFSNRAVEAGIRSRDGRGGFDFLAGHIVACGYGIDQLRMTYAKLSAGSDSLPMAA